MAMRSVARGRDARWGSSWVDSGGMSKASDCSMCLEDVWRHMDEDEEVTSVSPVNRVPFHEVRAHQRTDLWKQEIPRRNPDRLD